MPHETAEPMVFDRSGQSRQYSLSYRSNPDGTGPEHQSLAGSNSSVRNRRLSYSTLFQTGCRSSGPCRDGRLKLRNAVSVSGISRRILLPGFFSRASDIDSLAFLASCCRRSYRPIPGLRSKLRSFNRCPRPVPAVRSNRAMRSSSSDWACALWVHVIS